MQKQNISSVGKRGFTLVELSVVIALLAILLTMTVTFTIAMNGFVGVNRAEYDYLEEHSKLKEEISNWLAERDVENNKFLVSTNSLSVENGEPFDSGIIKNFDSIGSVTFDIISYDANNDGDIAPEENKLIKCTTESVSGKSQTFVVWMRFATIAEVLP